MKDKQNARRTGTSPTLILTEGAVMIALSFALSFIGPEMPMGGRVTPASMLPVILFSLRQGILPSLGCGAVTVMLQIFQAMMSGDVFVYCETMPTMVICVLFDYALPFMSVAVVPAIVYTLAKGRGAEGRKLAVWMYMGVVIAVTLRFACHFVSGVAIWGQWAPEGMTAALYSVLYNGGFLLPELIILLLVQFALCRSGAIRRLLGLQV